MSRCDVICDLPQNFVVSCEQLVDVGVIGHWLTQSTLFKGAAQRITVNSTPAADDSDSFSDFSLSNRDRKLAGYKCVSDSTPAGSTLTWLVGWLGESSLGRGFRHTDELNCGRVGVRRTSPAILSDVVRQRRQDPQHVEVSADDDGTRVNDKQLQHTRQLVVEHRWRSHTAWSVDVEHWAAQLFAAVHKYLQTSRMLAVWIKTPSLMPVWKLSVLNRYFNCYKTNK